MTISYYDQKSINSLKEITKVKDEKDEINRRKSCLNLLEAIRAGNNELISHLKNIIDSGGGLLVKENDFNFSFKLTKDEYINPPTAKQKVIFNDLRKITPLDACYPGLWLYINIKALENRVIESHYFVSKGSGSKSKSQARKEIAKLINGSNKKVKKNPEYLNYTRLALRRLFGAISERGLKAVFTDVPLARAWWKVHLAESMCEQSEHKAGSIEPDDILEFFNHNPTIYEVFFENMSSKLTVVGDIKIRNAIAKFIIEKDTKNKQEDEKSVISVKDFTKLIKDLGIISASRGLGSLSIKENTVLISKLYKLK